MEVLTLDNGGIALALAMGLAVIVLGGSFWYFFLSLMLLFLAFSAFVTYIKRDHKIKAGLSQKARGIRNVMANGTVPLVMTLAYRLALNAGNASLATVSIFGFVASVAAITSDKFGSEIGVLGERPWSVLGAKTVKKGTSGAVTPLGLSASLLGSILIAVPAFFLLMHSYVNIVGIIGIVIIAGFFGSFVDTLFGYFEEKGIGSKYTTNFLCSLAGLAVMLVFFAIV